LHNEDNEGMLTRASRHTGTGKMQPTLGKSSGEMYGCGAAAVRLQCGCVAAAQRQMPPTRRTGQRSHRG